MKNDSISAVIIDDSDDEEVIVAPPKAKMAPMMAKTMKLVKGIKSNFRK